MLKRIAKFLTSKVVREENPYTLERRRLEAPRCEICNTLLLCEEERDHEECCVGCSLIKETHIKRRIHQQDLKEIVRQLERCGYECVAGPLENNVAFIALKRIAEGERI